MDWLERLLSIPLGELDFLGRRGVSSQWESTSNLSIPLGELDFLGPRAQLNSNAILSFQFPLGN